MRTGTTDAERKLLRMVKLASLRTSLASLREAADAIWSNDAPRVIQDFTDHTLQHSLRVAGFARDILRANSGRSLSEEEAYLLIAAIYLHDIGMQCDVIR
jgi:HD-GYP domain-containing protein (c-di-GMP phosphodiesterase class II)